MSDITLINDSEQSQLVTNGLAVNGELYLKKEGSTDAGSIVVYDSGSWRTFANEASSGAWNGNTYSIDLDGSNDYIDCGGDADFSFTDGSGNDQPFSVSAWVKLDSSNRQRIVAKGNAEWLFGTDGADRFSLFLWSQGTTSAYLAAGYSGLSTGVWHQMVATYDGSKSFSGINFYLNGSSINTSNISSGIHTGMSANQGSLRIGQWETNSSVMNGLVDEVSVFNYELTSSQVSNIYNSGTPADISSLSPLGWWRMGDNDSGTGTTITDQGSGSNNGTLTNGPTFSTTVPS